MRLPQSTYVKFIVTILSAMFTVILFYNGLNGEYVGRIQGVMNRNGCLFFMILAIAFNAIQHVILIFPDERPVFLREVNNNMYSVTPYFLAKQISELPLNILTPIVFGAMCYFLIGLNSTHPYNFWVFSKCHIFLTKYIVLT